VQVCGKRSAQIVLIRRGRSRDTDPLFALHEWLAATDIRDDEALFQHIAPGGGMTSGEALAPADVGRIIRRRAADAGLDNPYLTGHSLRRGHLITMWAEGAVEL
jgi:integrase